MADRLRAERTLHYPVGESLKRALAAGGLPKLIAEDFEAATGTTIGRLTELKVNAAKGHLSAPQTATLKALEAEMQAVEDSIEFKHVKAGSFCDFIRKDLPSSSVDILLRDGKVVVVKEEKKATKKSRAKKKGR